MNISKRIVELLSTIPNKGQNEIAQEIGIAPSVISKLKQGQSKDPSAETIVAIAKYFNVSTDWLLGLTDFKSTSQASKELCATLGLSDDAVLLLSDSKNQDLRTAVNFLFDQHMDHLWYVNHENPNIGETENWYFEKWTYFERSLLAQITSLVELFNTPADVEITLQRDGSVEVTNIDKAPSFHTTHSSIKTEYNETVSLNLYMRKQIIERIVMILNYASDRCSPFSGLVETVKKYGSPYPDDIDELKPIQAKEDINAQK